MIYNRPYEILTDAIFLRLPGLRESIEVSLKIEGLNPSGSIKLKPAVAMVERAEREGLLRPGDQIVESSSGSLGTALASIAAARGYRFTCVVDPNLSPTTRKIMRAFGARIVTVDRRDPNGGYLQSRIAAVKEIIDSQPDSIWLNQYDNPANPNTHRKTTALSILEEFEQVDYLFVGVGTAGTLMGCLEQFRELSPKTTIVAVDSIGSITFGRPPGIRMIPGLGSSRMPPLFRSGAADFQVEVSEARTIETCHKLAREYGYLAGGSTGTVVAAVLEHEIEPGAVVVAVSPDNGDRYIDTIFDDGWVDEFHQKTPSSVGESGHTGVSVIASDPSQINYSSRGDRVPS